MRLDGRYTAVVDRFEDDQAVVLVEQDGDVVEERLVERECLPADAGQDAVLRVTVDSGTIRNLEYLPEETEQRTQSAQDRFDRLSRRPPSGDDEDEDEDGESDTDDAQ